MLCVYGCGVYICVCVCVCGMLCVCVLCVWVWCIYLCVCVCVCVRCGVCVQCLCISMRICMCCICVCVRRVCFCMCVCGMCVVCCVFVCVCMSCGVCSAYICVCGECGMCECVGRRGTQRPRKGGLEIRPLPLDSGALGQALAVTVPGPPGWPLGPQVQSAGFKSLSPGLSLPQAPCLMWAGACQPGSPEGLTQGVGKEAGSRHVHAQSCCVTYTKAVTVVLTA